MLGLGTLIKYEFKTIGRIMLPLYGAFLAVSILFGVSIMGNAEYSGVFGALFTGFVGFAYFAMAVAIVVLAAIILIQRFHKSLLGNEGYLYFTLPVSTNAHLANKTISAGIWLTLSAIAGMISLAILGLFAAGADEVAAGVRSVFMAITDFEGGFKVVLIVIEVIVLALATLAEAALKIYAAISVGHQWAKHRVLGAVGAYIGFCIIEGIFAGIFEKMLPLEAVFENHTSAFTAMQLGMLTTFIVIIITTAIYWIVNYIMLDRHLNLQ